MRASVRARVTHREAVEGRVAHLFSDVLSDSEVVAVGEVAQ